MKISAPRKRRSTAAARKRRSKLLVSDFGVAIDHACKELDEARENEDTDLATLHDRAKVIRALLTASDLDDDARVWS